MEEKSYYADCHIHTSFSDDSQCPMQEMLERAIELGGKIITIGSDTHETKHLADHISEMKKELRNLGFDEFCTFEKMKPVYHKL